MARKRALEFVRNENGCFIVTSHKPNCKGYACITMHGKLIRVNRFVYEQCFGEIPEGLVIRHTCDVTTCINPEHLILGTQQDNMMDMVKRNRSLKGENHNLVKLTEDDVRSIRADIVHTHEQIGHIYGVAKTTVTHIRADKIWKHLL